MTSFVRLAILACAVMMIGSATVTYAIERNRAQKARAAAELAARTAAPVAVAHRSTCDAVLAARRAALRRSYDVAPTDMYSGPPAPVVFTGWPEALTFRTKLREAMRGGVNFGGRYVVATWGCGDSCEDHAVLDAMTGTIVAFGLRTQMGMQYSARSRLMVANPRESFPASNTADMTAFDLAQRYGWIAREYYEVADSNSTIYFTKVCVENPFDGHPF